MENQNQIVPNQDLTPVETPVSSPANTPVQNDSRYYPIENLEAPSTTTLDSPGQTSVDPQNQFSSQFKPDDPVAPKRKGRNKVIIAIILSAVLISGVLGWLWIRQNQQKQQSLNEEIPEQNVQLTGLDSGLAGLAVDAATSQVLINGNVVTTGSIYVADSGTGFFGQLSIGDLSENQTYNLPDSSGTVCLDSNNCGFATDTDGISNLIAGSGITINGGTIVNSQVITTVNDFDSDVVIQGTTNQVSVASSDGTITISTPQDLAVSSSPTFDSLTITTSATQGGNELCDISNNCGYAGGANAFVQDGNSFGAAAVLGTNDNNTLSFETNGTTRMTINEEGSIGIGTAAANEIGIFGAKSINSSHSCIFGCYGGAFGLLVDDPANPNLAVGLLGGVTTAASPFVLHNAYAINAGNPTLGAGSTITNNFGLYVNDQTSGTNDYGIAIAGADTQALWIGSGANNTDAANGIAFGLSRDTNLYRSAANTLRTDSNAWVYQSLAVGDYGDDSTFANLSALGIGEIFDDTNFCAFGCYGIYNSVSSDRSTSLGQLAAQVNSVNVEDGRTVGNAIGLRIANGSVGAGGTLTNNFGIQVDDMTSGTNDYGIAIAGADTQALWISYGADNTDAANGIGFGASLDTNLYRGAANQLSTDDNLDVALHGAIGNTASINQAGWATYIVDADVYTPATSNNVLTISETFSDLSSTEASVGIVNSITGASGAGGTGVLLGFANTTIADTSSGNNVEVVNGLSNYVNITGTGDFGYVTGMTNSVDARGLAVDSVGALIGSANYVYTSGTNDSSVAYGQFISVSHEGVAGADLQEMYGLSILLGEAGSGGGVGVARGLTIGATGGSIANSIGIQVSSQTGTTSGYGIAVEEAQTQTLWISSDADSTTANAGIGFGTSLDTNLYRSGANVLRTDDVLSVGTLGATDTSAYLCYNSLSQLAACSGSGSGTAFVQGGNSFGATAVLGTNDSYNLELETDGTTRLTIDTSGNATLTGSLDIGTRLAVGSGASINTDQLIYANETFTNNSGAQIGTDVRITTNPGGASTATVYGGNYSLTVAAGASNNADALRGVGALINHAGGGTVDSATGTYGSVYGTGVYTDAYGASGQYINQGTGTTTNGWGVRGAVQNTSSGTITNPIGVYGVASQAGSTLMSQLVGISGTVDLDVAATAGVTDAIAIRATNYSDLSFASNFTNTYGIYVEDQTGGATSEYGIAIVGADTQALWIGSGADNTDAANGIAFGSSRDTNLYRSAANVLKTDDVLSVGTLGATDTAAYLCYNSLSQLAACSGASSGSAFVQGGNSFGAIATLGTNDTFDIDFITDGVVRGTIGSAGRARFGASGVGGGELEVVASEGNDYPGLVVYGSTGASNAAAAHIYSRSSSAPGLVVQGEASQTGSLQEWRDGGGDVLTAISASGQLQFADGSGASPDTNLYRGAANQLFTDDSIDVAGHLAIGDDASVDMFGHTILTIAESSGSANQTYGIMLDVESQGSGVSPDATGAFLAIGAWDSAAYDNIIATDSQAYYEGDNTVNNLLGHSVYVENGGGGGAVTNLTGVDITVLGDAADTTAYGINVGTVSGATSNYGIAIGNTGTQTLWVGSTADGTTAADGIAFGESRDTNLYRSAADTLRTDDTLSLGSYLALGLLGPADTDVTLCMSSSDYLAACAGGAGSAFLDGGNSFGAIGTIGTNDANSLAFETGGVTQATINTSGQLGLNTSTFGTNNRLLVNPYNTVDNLATAQISATAATNKGLVVQGFTGQTASLTEWQSSAGSIISSITASGNLWVRHSGTATLLSGSGGSAQERSVIQYNPSNEYTSILSNGSEKGRFGATGGLQVGAFSTTIGANEKLAVNRPVTADSLANTILTASAATAKPLVVQGYTSQTANLIEAQDSAGTVLFDVESDGDVTLEASNLYRNKTLEIEAYSTAEKGTLRFETGDQLSGSIVSRHDGTGSGGAGGLDFYVNRLASTPLVYQNGLYLESIANRFLAGNAAWTGLVVKGAAAQTANLQSWQNSSDQIYAAVDSAGKLQFADGAGGSVDTNLYRSAANTLKTDDSLEVATALNVGSGELQVWSAATNLVDISARVRIGTTSGLGSATMLAVGTSSMLSGVNVEFQASASTNVLQVFRGASSQTADLTQWRDSAGTILSGVNASGQGYFGTTSSSYGGSSTPFLAVTSSGVTARFVNTGTSGISQGAGMVGYSDDGAAMASGDRLAYFLGGGATDASSSLVNAAGMTLFASEAWSSTNNGAEIRFETTPNGSTTASRVARVTIPNNVDGFTFGSAGDTNLYRSAASTLRTDDALLVQGTISSSPGTGSSSERFGASTTASGTGSLAVGASASTSTYNTSIAIGNSAVVTANDGFSVGRQATSNQASMAIGNESSSAGGSSIAIGFQANAGHSSSITIGRGATSTGANQLVLGGGSNAISNVFIGNGVAAASPSGFTLNATAGSGTDIAGASLNIAGGRGTGTGNGGNVSLQIADPGTTGSSQNSLATVMQLSGINGAAYFQNTTDSTTGFRILDADGGTSIVSVDTTDEQVGIGTDSAAYKLDVNTDAAASYVANFFNDGNDQARNGIRIQAGADDASGTTYYLDAYDGDGGQVGYIANNAGTFGVTDVSDARTKTNIQDTSQDASAILSQLRVVDFNRLQNPDGPLITGFIAQEVQDVYGQAVTTGADGMLGVMKDAFIPLLVKGHQDQELTLESLAAEIDALQQGANNGGANSSFDGNIASLNVSGAATINDLEVTGSATVAELTVTGDATFAGDITVEGDLRLAGKVLGNQNTRGTVTVQQGQTEVEFTFDDPFTEAPNVILTATNTFAPSYRVEAENGKFTIYLKDPATEDIIFNYQAQQ